MLILVSLQLLSLVWKKLPKLQYIFKSFFYLYFFFHLQGFLFHSSFSFALLYYDLKPEADHLSADAIDNMIFLNIWIASPFLL